MTQSLPSHPSLRYLKEQAKDILKAHGKGDPSCCAVLKHLKPFTQKSN